MNNEKPGLLIAKQRKLKKLTQTDLADKLGISTNAVSKWERGLSFPDVSLYKPLCKELDISLEELINGELDNSENAKNKAIISTIESKEKVKRKLIKLSMISSLIIILLIIIGIFIYKNGKDDLEDYYERNYQKTFVARNVEAILKYRNDGKYPDYYGGVYISDDAYNLIVLIVKDKIPKNNTREFYYYNELITLDKSIKIEYVKNSYNELEYVNNKIVDYLINNEISEDFNAVGIDVINNRVVVNYVKVTEEIKKEFKEKVIDSDIVEFEQNLNYTNNKNECTNYPISLGTKLEEKDANALMSISVGNKQYVPVSLAIYDDGTYELFTAFRSCRPGKICTEMFQYTMSVKGTYSYDVEKILEASTNANDKTYSMDNLPEYEITLGTLVSKYDTLTFTVEKGKTNKYLNEFLKMIDVDLSKCAKPEYR